MFSSYYHLLWIIHSNIPRQACADHNSSRFFHEVPMILYWTWNCGNFGDFTGHLLHLQSALLEGPRWLLHWDLPRVATGSRHGGIFWDLHTGTLGVIPFLWQDPITSLFVVCGLTVCCKFFASCQQSVGFVAISEFDRHRAGKVKLRIISNDLVVIASKLWTDPMESGAVVLSGTTFKTSLMPQMVKPRSNFLLSLPDQISMSPTMAHSFQAAHSFNSLQLE